MAIWSDLEKGRRKRDVDSILTLEEEIKLEKSLEEHRTGKTMRLEDFEKSM